MGKGIKEVKAFGLEKEWTLGPSLPLSSKQGKQKHMYIRRNPILHKHAGSVAILHLCTD
jgi:hypothetical protein